MSDEDALLAAIAAHPEEDTPRFMFADWLDEHGQPLRAEFIRVQCAVKQLEQRPAEEQRQHVHLWRRQEEFLDLHRRDLLGPLGGELTYFDVIFDRGFVSELTVPAPVFLHHAEAIRAFRPAPRVRVTLDGEATFEALVLCPELNLVEALVAPRVVWGEAGARRLAECPYLGRLEVLDLQSNAIDDEGLRALAFSVNLPRLTELNLGWNAVTDSGIHMLVGSPLWPRLRRLDLSGNPLTDWTAELLTDAAHNGIEFLSLRMTQIGSEGHMQLLRRYGGRVDLF